MKQIVLLGEPCLRDKSVPVTEFDDKLRLLGDTLVATMTANNGLGLAAPQVGISKRVISVRIGTREEPRALVLVNPVFTHKSEEMAEGEEGCLSIPGVRLSIERSKSVSVTYQDVLGDTNELDADGLLAVCLQHEVDHLDGTLILDRVSRLRRDRARAQFEKHVRLNAKRK